MHPRFASHRAALRFTLHFVPFFEGTQHVTAPGFPHVDLTAQPAATFWQSFGSDASRPSRFNSLFAQLTYAPCEFAVAQPQALSTSRRAATRAAGALHVASEIVVVVVLVTGVAVMLVAELLVGLMVVVLLLVVVVVGSVRTSTTAFSVGLLSMSFQKLARSDDSAGLVM